MVSQLSDCRVKGMVSIKFRMMLFHAGTRDTARRLVWVNKQLPDKLKYKKEAYRAGKQGQVAREECREIV